MSSPLQNNITNLQNLLDKVNALPESGGVDLPELTNEATSSELFSGKELIDDEGNVVTGTFTIDTELSAQDNLIAQIQTALEGKAAGGSSGDTSVETCTVTITLNAGSINCAMANVLVDGIITPYGSGRGNGTLTTLTIENVVCNSLVLIQYSNIMMIGYSCSGDLTQLPNASGSGIIGFKAPSEAGASASCTIWDNF